MNHIPKMVSPSPRRIAKLFSIYHWAVCSAVKPGLIGGSTPAIRPNVTPKTTNMTSVDHAAAFSIFTCMGAPIIEFACPRVMSAHSAPSTVVDDRHVVAARLIVDDPETLREFRTAPDSGATAILSERMLSSVRLELVDQSFVSLRMSSVIVARTHPTSGQRSAFGTVLRVSCRHPDDGGPGSRIRPRTGRRRRAVVVTISVGLLAATAPIRNRRVRRRVRSPRRAAALRLHR